MSQLLIEVHDPEDEALLVKFVSKLNATLIQQSTSAIPKPKSSESPITIMQRIADRGGIKEFGDASEWQREIRSWDRVLDGREE